MVHRNWAIIALGSRAGHAVETACTRGTDKGLLIDRTFGPMARGRPPQIVAYGGGGFSMEPGNPLLDEYVLSLCRRKKPKVCFFPTASGDADHYVVRFYRHFSSEICDPSHISLFRRDRGPGKVREHLLKQDLIYVGGGSILSLLGVWRAHGIDEDLRAAWQAGVILVGVSAGSLCWFASGLTAYHHDAKPYDGLGFLPHSNAVHYEEEDNRRPAYHSALLDGSLPGGYAASDGAALHFVGEDLHRVVLSRPKAHAFRVEAVGDEVVELPLDATYLGDRPKITLAAA
jgi:dipeptidase E